MRTKNLIILTFLGICFIVGHGCKPTNKVVDSGGIQKRKYRKGYHTDFKKGKTNHSREKKTTKKVTYPFGPKNSIQEGDLKTIHPKKGDLTLASREKGLKEVASLTPKQEHLRSKNNDCAIIFLRDGKEIKAKIIQLGTEKIKYKKCGRESGPTYVKKKSKVYMIKYPDGSKDVIKKEKKDPDSYKDGERKPPETQSSNNEKNSNQSLGIVGFLLGLIGTIVGLLISSIAGALLSFGGLILSIVGEGNLAVIGGVLSGLSLLIIILLVVL